MEDLTGFQRDLLTVLAGLVEPNGLEVKTELESYYESSINHGRLYPNLDTLVEKGLVEKQQEGDRTNVYRITEAGLTTLQTRRTWEDDYVEVGGEILP